MQEKYLNLFTDFAFKRIFGEEKNKENLIAFLNTLLPQKHQIEDLQYTNPEYQGLSEFDRKAIFDLNCVSASGEQFIVELQKQKQKFFKDRSVFYASFPIQRQAQRGETWNYRLSAVYSIGILDFIFDDEEPETRGDVVHEVKLKNQHNQVFYDKLTFIYLTLPNFKKSEAELESEQDKWFYVFRHLHRLEDLPGRLKGRVFERIFRQAQIGKLTREEQEAYEASIKVYRDYKNSMDTAREVGEAKGRAEGLAKGRAEGLAEGRAEGLAEGRAEGLAEGVYQRSLEVARQMKQEGMETGLIARITGLRKGEIDGL